VSEETLLWGLSLLVVAAVVLPYAFAFRRRRRADRARKAEAVRLGFDKPTAQYPFVDPRSCIGCGACVEACPEGDVLGIVGGFATVINGLRCVGHGRCELACPVGAIEVGLGDVKNRRDVPEMDEWQETTVPGLFVAGELGGMALVRNAVTQSRKVVARIAERSGEDVTARRAGVFDVAIVGAGPAGLAAAAAATERGLTHIVFEQEPDLGGTILHYPRRKLVLVQAVEVPVLGLLREAEYSKEELLRKLLDLADRARLEIRFGEKVADIQQADGLFSVESSSGPTLARFVILAMGRRGTPRKLGVRGEELAKVMYQLADAASYADNRLLVVGGGDSAVEAAIGLARQRGNRVTLSYRRERLVRIKKKNEDRIETLLARGRVSGLFGSEVQEIEGDAVRLATPSGVVDLPNDYVFVFAGGDPPFGFLQKIGVRFGGEPSLTAPASGG
jgi:thioredoxin reductase/NAD-dependent dihydropyrimidine dehydrogenase PreA subunit